MSKHTPGPWHAKIDKCGNASIFAKDVCVADCLKREANLIAAAPDLLNALQALILLDEELVSDNAADVLAKARAAIAKATGEQA